LKLLIAYVHYQADDSI